MVHDDRELIEGYLRGLTAIPGVSGSEAERLAGEYLEGCLRGQAYFAAHPELCGGYALAGDPLERKAVWGLVRGKGKRTLILTGHYDVVDAGEYGKFADIAYEMDGWKRLADKEREEFLAMLGREAAEDLLSGEWIFGRGVSDMKGGLAVGLAILDWFGRSAEKREGNLLFLAVPDEEAYSAGMRGALSFLADLAEHQGLEYEGLIDLEPSFREDGGLKVHVGSVGKLMPAVLVQGAKAHVLEPFAGISAAGVLAELVLRTEAAPEFVQRCEGESCPPPVWLQMRDRKEGYDVSLPERAGGYMNLLQFSGSPGEIMESLVRLGREAFAEYLARIKRRAREIEDGMEAVSGAAAGGEENAACGRRLTGGRAGSERPLIDWRSEVMSFSELTERCCQMQGTELFKTWFAAEYERTAGEIQAGRLDYPRATLELMEAVLTRSGIAGPAMVFAFAPPYYPPYHGDRIAGREGESTRLFGLLEQAAREVRAAQRAQTDGGERETAAPVLVRRNYFCGISDLSYCGGSAGSGAAEYEAQTPLWGAAHRLDEEALGRFAVPALLFGPEGRDIHRMSERVRAESLYRETPEILRKFIEQMFAIERRI